ncbi:unnamed protein product [Calypogeia fissa]
MANSFRQSKHLGIAASIHLSNSVGSQSSIRRSHSMSMGMGIGREVSESSRQLLSKAKEGDAFGVGFLLDQPSEALVDVNARGELQMTALHLAVENNHEKVLIRLLLEKSTDLDAQDELGRTALIIAAQQGLPRVTQMLQEAGANVLLCALGGYTALHVAAWYGHVEVVNLLLGILEAGEFRNGEFTFPKETVKKPKSSHFSSGKDLPSPQGIKRKLFKKSSEGVFESNLEKQSKQSTGKVSNSSSVYDEFGDTSPPGDSLKFELSKVVKLKMLESKTSTELFTPLHLAAGNGHREVVESLIQAYGEAVGISEVFNSVQERGGKEALNTVRTSIIQILKSQADRSSDEDVKTLDIALERILFPNSERSSISWSTVEDMVSYVNQKDYIRRTPLHYAIWGQHAGVVEQLLEFFIVNVNAVDMDGFTPLHLGCRKGSENEVELLLSHDSKFQTLNPNLQARQNKATWAKILEVKRLQQKLGILLTAMNFHEVFFSEERDGMTALHYAVEQNHEAIVAALANHGAIDVFAVASPATKSSVMEVLAAENGDEKCQTPLAMAFSRNNSNVLLKLLKSGKRNKIMQDLQTLRGYFTKPSKFEGNRLTVKQYHRELLKTAVRLIKLDYEVTESELFSNLERELSVTLNTLMLKPGTNTYTLLHHAAFAGLSTEIEVLLSNPKIAKEINAADVDNQTALHFAVMEEEFATVKVLMNDKTIKPNEEDRHNRTSLQIASEKGSREIISLLMECPDVTLAVERLYRERGVNDNAANAILVVAALIASVTYGGWLQPPLGLIAWNDVNAKVSSNSTQHPNYAAVIIPSVRYFWIFNTISFYFAMATVISGAAEVLPMRDAFIGQEVRMVRGGLVRSSMLLVMSVIAVLIAFAAAGFACLPPIDDYDDIMLWPTVWGVWVCFSMLCIFWVRMGSMLVTRSGHHQLKWLRFQEADLMALPAGKFLWAIFKIFKFIPENYTRFQSSRQEDRPTFKKRVFFYLVKVFRLDREEYWRYQMR